MVCLQVALNQFALGPVVLATSFAWNLVLTGQATKFLGKLRSDGPPSMATGNPPPPPPPPRLHNGAKL